MKAAVIHRQGEPEVLCYEELADPVPGPDEVVVAVEAISIEGGDLHSRSILPIERFPHVLGYQAGGRVAALGRDVTEFGIGDRVVAFNFSGSHAEKFCVPAATVFAVPDGLDMRVASTIPVTFGTADDALFAAGGLESGETLFVRGATGGVGLAAVQLAKAAGATVIATARSSHGADRLQRLGAHHIIFYDQVDYAAEVLRLTDGKGADLVVDLVGGNAQATADLLSTIAYRGRLSVVGLASGEAPTFRFWDIVPKNMRVCGVLFGLEMATPRGRAIVMRHLQAAAEGRLDMPIVREFALAEAAAAHRYIEQQRPFGRVLLIP